MISSELPEVLGMSDRVAVIHEGSISALLDTKDTNQEEILTFAAGYDKIEEREEAIIEGEKEAEESVSI